MALFFMMVRFGTAMSAYASFILQLGKIAATNKKSIKFYGGHFYTLLGFNIVPLYLSILPEGRLANDVRICLCEFVK